jgi:hypothetical protein
MIIGKIISLAHDTDMVKVHLWDWQTDDWADKITSVYKPTDLRPSDWDGKTLKYIQDDGTSLPITYTTDGVDPKCERRVIFSGGGQTQEITPPYKPDKILYLDKLQGCYYDLNRAGRLWKTKQGD